MKGNLYLIITSMLLCSTLVQTADGEVVTDGSLGSAQSLAGPDFMITESLGRRAGNNLFHSFTSFNINQAESATFTGDSSISTVISRVTGGRPSHINGILSSEIGTADFFFLNPAGVLFGPTAWIDVPASLHVSSGDSLVFRDGKSFSAADPSTSSLSMAEPEAFGFVTGSNGDIRIDNSLLWLQPESTLSIVGGNITMDTGLAAVENGELRLIANGTAPGTVPVDGDTLPHIGNGLLKLVGSEISGQDSTGIFLSGGEIILDSSNIYHAALNHDSDGSITLNSNELFLDNESQISTIAGDIYRSADIRISAQTDITLEGKSTISSESLGSGDGGSVSVDSSGTFTIGDGSFIFSNSAFEGDAGSIQISAMDLTIDGNSQTTGIVSEAKAGSSGQAGSVSVDAANRIEILDGGIISSNTFGEGDAGSVHIEATGMNINGGRTQTVTGISSEAGSGSLGNAGEVSIDIDDALGLFRGGVISSSTWGEGDAGLVSIKAGEALVEGFGRVTGVTTQSNKGATGDGGSISLDIGGNMAIFSGGSISSSTQGSGDAGSVEIRSSDLVINGAATSLFTGVESRAEQGAHGNVGDIVVRTITGQGEPGSVRLVNNGQISIGHYGSSGSGSVGGQARISIKSGEVVLSGSSRITSESTGNVPAANIGISASNILSIEELSRVSSESNNADAGDIHILSTPYLVLANGLVTTSVNGTTGDGGDINIATPILIMDSGFVQANTRGAGGRGGAITIYADHLIGSYGTVDIGGGTPFEFQAGSHTNIIQAAAPEGVPGNIEISTPVTDITGSLLPLNSDFRNQADIEAQPCRVEPGAIPSSLVWGGQGGLPPSPADPLSIPLADRCRDAND